MRGYVTDSERFNSSTGNRALLCIKDSEGWVQQRSWPLRRPQTGVEDGGDEASIPAFIKFSRCSTSIVWAYPDSHNLNFLTAGCVKCSPLSRQKIDQNKVMVGEKFFGEKRS